jgi:serine O-acetyltransferase
MNVEEFCNAVSAEEPDWSREEIRCFWDPGRKLLRSIRRYQSCKAQKGIFSRIGQRYWALNHRFWSVVTQCEIHLECEIAGGLLLPHPTGIVLHPHSRIGPNCLIFHQVTFGGENVVIGGHVDIGAGAKLLGPINVGNHVQIGANAVVTRNVPDCSIAIGVPARNLA